MSDKIVVKNLTKIFGRNPSRAFDLMKKGMGKDEILEKLGSVVGVMDANFSVKSNEVFVVMGLSGSGKSTLVRMLNRLIEPTSGEIYVNEKNVMKMNYKELQQLRRHTMSMVFQTFALMPHMKVIDNVSFGLGVAGLSRSERHKRAMAAIEQVGLTVYIEHYPQELSGGMQQRVGLARALSQNPEILLMDEAFSALDPLIRGEMQNELLKLQKVTERTVVFISHDLPEAIRIGDRIAIMEDGRIVQVGTPTDIMNNPADKYVESFFHGVDPTTVFASKDVAQKNQLTLHWKNSENSLHLTLDQMRKENRKYGYVLDNNERFVGVVSDSSLKEAIERGNSNIREGLLKNVKPVLFHKLLQDILTMINHYDFPVPVVDKNNIYLGVISKKRFLSILEHGIKKGRKGN